MSVSSKYPTVVRLFSSEDRKGQLLRNVTKSIELSQTIFGTQFQNVSDVAIEIRSELCFHIQLRASIDKDQFLKENW